MFDGVPDCDDTFLDARLRLVPFGFEEGLFAFFYVAVDILVCLGGCEAPFIC